MIGQTREQSIDLGTANRATELEAHAQRRLGGQVRNFRLVVTGKGLILHSHAQTYYAKQPAQHAVMEATRLPILANEIEVS
jgi:hypothetical protein